MDAWAKRYGASASFVCVSCAGPQLATQFGNQQRLQHCHNTWVDQDDMPTWGQLGCNGFIILDGSHSVVCKASRAYLEVREEAFRHVETLLSALIVEKAVPEQQDGRVDPSVGGACATVRFGDDKEAPKEQPASAPLVGCRVRIDGVASRPQLNGREGRAVRFDAAKGRYVVEVEGEETVMLLPSKLEAAAAAKVASVKVDVLDEEHERCEAALARLAAERNVASLRALLTAYEGHFAHEEALLDQHLYADVVQATGFSAEQGARTSHFGDHGAMLAAIRKLVADRDGQSEELASLSAAEVQQLASDFERHATAYDGSYADRLSAAMAAAA